MRELSAISRGVQASATLKVDGIYKQMKSEGLDVIGFGAGEPDFNTPDNINQAAFTAIKTGLTRYTPAAGLAELRKAAATRISDDCGVSYEPTEIVAASGAKHSIFIALMCLLNPGDEVILPAPYWVTYTEAIKLCGAIPVIIPANENTNFKISAAQLENAVTDKTKLFIINNPSNPTGMLYNKAELSALAEVCLKHDLYILSDEIYSRLVYDGKLFTSMAALDNDVKEHTIIVNGVSKTYAMTGWRIGYTASNREIAKVMSDYLSHSTGAPSTISQAAAIEALSGDQSESLKMRDTFAERRNYITKRINAIDGLSCKIPDGAFYVMLNITKQLGKTLAGRVINNSDDFALALLEKGLVAVVSCTGFGIDNFVRLTYACSMQSITEGLDRIEKFVSTQ